MARGLTWLEGLHPVVRDEGKTTQALTKLHNRNLGSVSAMDVLRPLSRHNFWTLTFVCLAVSFYLIFVKLALSVLV